MRRAKAAARRAAALLAALTLLAAPAIAAGAAEPAHVLSYTTGRLTWDSATGIDENGAAVLSLFADAYQNVLSENGERVVAPGTDGSCTVRLENRMGYAISYIAVAYRIKEVETLPVEPEFSCEGAEDTGSYPLPEGVEDAQVIRAVRGELSGGQSADFRLDWLWEYYESDARDVLDTALGDKAASDTPDDVTAGIYIVVEEEQPDPPVPTPDPTPVHSEPPDKPDKPAETDAPDGPGDTDDTDGGYIRPEVPKTGDESAAWLSLSEPLPEGVDVYFDNTREVWFSGNICVIPNAGELPAGSAAINTHTLTFDTTGASVDAATNIAVSVSVQAEQID